MVDALAKLTPIPVLVAVAALSFGCASAPPTASKSADYPPGGAAATMAPADAPAPPASEPAAVPMDAKGGGDADEGSVASATPSSAQGQPSTPGAGGMPRDAAKMPAKKDSSGRSEETPLKPGLGTEWGETRVSRITTSPFVRADPTTPFATVGLFYNDETGARALAGGSALQPIPGNAVSVGGGTVSIGLKDQAGRFFNAFVAGGRQVVVGSAGRSYTIVVKNNTSNRFECVLSVDGLDVLDGKTASFTKRGYILDPRGEIEVDGFRQSVDTVAAFRFGSVQSSYANQKHGETRNVGVIGLAIFNEQGGGWTNEAVQQRRDANPFPGNR